MSRQVSENSRRTWEELPSFLRWRPGSVNSEDSGSLLIPLYLDFLYNDFLLYRLLVRRSQNESDALINISQSILGTVLQLIGREIAAGTGTYNIGWNVSHFSNLKPQVLTHANDFIRHPGCWRPRHRAAVQR